MENPGGEGKDGAGPGERVLSGSGDTGGGRRLLPGPRETAGLAGRGALGGAREDGFGDRGLRVHGLVLPRLQGRGAGDGEGVPGDPEKGEADVHRPPHPYGEPELPSLQPVVPRAGEGELSEDPKSADAPREEDEGADPGGGPEGGGAPGGHLSPAELRGSE